jgi:hypothetical protein
VVPLGAAPGGLEPPDGTADGSGLARARARAVIGAVFTAVILWFMLVASAATLGRHQQTVTSAQDAARALCPLAGSAAAAASVIGGFGTPIGLATHEVTAQVPGDAEVIRFGLTLTGPGQDGLRQVELTQIGQPDSDTDTRYPAIRPA